MTLVKNRSDLLSGNLTESQKILRETALECLEAALEAVRPRNLIRQHLKVEKESLFVDGDEYSLNEYEKVYVIGCDD